jgi:hypothetical protein
MEESLTFTAFAGHKLLVRGDVRSVVLAIKSHTERTGNASPVLVFEDQSGRQVDFDVSGSEDDVLSRIAPAPKGPGRPKLGVVSREISLLPRHWEWLERQPHGISAAVRRLIDDARKKSTGAETARLARDAASKVMWAIAGDFPDFEEASRALFAIDRTRFEALIRAWPKDVRSHIREMAAPSFADPPEPESV